MNRLCLVLLVFTACGDNHDIPDARNGDASGPADSHPVVPRAVAVAGDFGSPGVGTISKLDLATLTMGQNLSQGAVLGDPVLRYADGLLYIVNRFGSNNVTILDGTTFALVDQISTGENSNPQDVAIVGPKLYVPALGTAGLVVLTRGSSATTTIDLSALDTMGPNDGKPDCLSAYAVGTKVYVACGLLDNFNAVQNGKVAVIDSTTDTLLATVEMSYKNPSGFFARAPATSTYTGDLLLATVPSYSDYSSGCIERVSTGDPTTVGCGLTNQQLAGFVNKLAVADDRLFIAVGTYDTSFDHPTGTVRSFDLDSGTLAAEPISTASELVVDVAACPGGDVVGTDQTIGAGGLRVWRVGVERTTDAMSIGLPPTTNALVCYAP